MAITFSHTVVAECLLSGIFSTGLLRFLLSLISNAWHRTSHPGYNCGVEGGDRGQFALAGAHDRVRLLSPSIIDTRHRVDMRAAATGARSPTSRALPVDEELTSGRERRGDPLSCANSRPGVAAVKCAHADREGQVERRLAR